MILMVPAVDFWKIVPELGLISRDNEEDGTVKVTEEAKTEEVLKTLINKDPIIVKENNASDPKIEGEKLEKKNGWHERDFRERRFGKWLFSSEVWGLGEEND